MENRRCGSEVVGRICRSSEGGNKWMWWNAAGMATGKGEALPTVNKSERITGVSSAFRCQG